ncbi:hypothetical protein [Spirosoma aerolatum]|uniref:hypothetical protein n=1 Tax=Spirosoma aerolatum TaxID=1211326 RepID=UPI0009AC6916|nr:hypothetical protein [Spirosoma aerolatum]
MRTKEEIQAEMSAVQDQFPTLKGLTSTSQVGFFKLLKDMWALLVMAIEQRQDTLIAQVMAAMADSKLGSLSWYVSQLKAFQFGDAVTVYEGARIGYATVNPDKQIIKQATVTEQPDGRLLAKVAKSVSGVLVPLATVELTALIEYVRQVKYAGVIVDVISLPADELRLEVTVKYDRLVLNGSGQLLTDITKYPVRDAIIAYLQALPFDSKINWTALTDSLQQLPGVADFNVTRTFIRAAGTTAWTEFARETTSRAGYMALNLNESVITYV